LPAWWVPAENARRKPNKAPRLPLDLVDGQARRTPRLGSQTVLKGEPKPLARADVNQLLGQIEVEGKRSAKTRLYGCLLTPATTVHDDAAEAAHDKAVLINHGAAVRLYDLLADRLRKYDALCGDGSAEARGQARAKIEALLPPDGWLGQLLSPTQGKLITADHITKRFPST
jgi:hypothetical protein